jgi:hypothetical protein
MNLISALFITFLVLKLCGVIAWSWWWVFAPLWMGFVLYALLITVLAVVSTLID